MDNLFDFLYTDIYIIMYTAVDNLSDFYLLTYIYVHYGLTIYICLYATMDNLVIFYILTYYIYMYTVY